MTTRSIDVRTPTTTIAASQPKRQFRLNSLHIFTNVQGQKKAKLKNRRQCWRIKICTHHDQPPATSPYPFPYAVGKERTHILQNEYSINGAHIIRPKIVFSISLCAIPPNFVHLWRRQRCRRRTLIVIIIILPASCGCVHSNTSHTHTSQHCQPFLCQQRATYNYYYCSSIQ